MIRVESLNKSVADKTILTDISFQIEDGECVALIGPNGAGKTTLMSCLLGDVKTTGGKIRILGQSPQAKGLKSKVTVLFQENLVQEKMKVRELIAFQKAIYKDTLSDEEIRALLRFSDKQYDSFASTLSGGQKRLLQFVLILIGKPDILFLDEPTAGMDTATRQYFWRLIDDLKAQDKTIIYSSHYIEEVEQTADRVLVLKEGQLLRDTTPYALKKEMRQKIFTVPISYRNLLERIDDASAIEEKRDNISFTSSQVDLVWHLLEEAKCPIADIEMTNRSLMDSIFNDGSVK
ncbi:MAG: ABC transporter ATP-binding protein [Streptococcus hyointestinalis]|uniref:ABC transporter ATP-binding protein n=1 Tax=Streptococcus hyointestinalis TaxID=1337 RepID=UPI0023F036C9|nr:ABC transporter ATP-binding protein [Streptococcus hyointestinalis]MCI6871417.1 ABC transporter ATP-binding protein [Streptococcus hyointestinalis]MDD7356526.1 ABC transporter ATP-binding protein [Streptococcus hyointestinalis]MDY4553927.1 ABC transporter ATP-binding protein [Streptococcus hyointestinalis]